MKKSRKKCISPYFGGRGSWGATPVRYDRDRHCQCAHTPRTFWAIPRICYNYFSKFDKNRGSVWGPLAKKRAQHHMSSFIAWWSTVDGLNSGTKKRPKNWLNFENSASMCKKTRKFGEKFPKNSGSPRQRTVLELKLYPRPAIARYRNCPWKPLGGGDMGGQSLRFTPKFPKNGGSEGAKFWTVEVWQRALQALKVSRF